ncbi:MAG: hypothetical protein R6U32_01885 [Candidatus Woesearchaeota archaeon]
MAHFDDISGNSVSRFDSLCSMISDTYRSMSSIFSDARDGISDAFRAGKSNILLSAWLTGASIAGVPAAAIAGSQGEFKGVQSESTKTEDREHKDNNTPQEPPENYLQPPEKNLDEKLMREGVPTLTVNEGETLREAVEASVPSTYYPKEKRKYKNKSFEFLEDMGYSLDSTANETGVVPLCIPQFGCNIDSVLTSERSGIDGTKTGGKADKKSQKTPPKDTDQGEGKDEITDVKDEADKGGDQERKKGGMIGYSQLGRGMNPASIFNTGSGVTLDKRYHIEAGLPFYGGLEETENDEARITDPSTGSLIRVIDIEKNLETQLSGFYAAADMRSGDSTLLSLRLQKMIQEGNFDINGEDVSDYRRESSSLNAGVKRGLYSIPGKFQLSGDLAFIYLEDNDKAEDEYGTYESDRQMYGGRAGLNLAFKLNMGDLEAVPGVGLRYDYVSGDDDDMHSMLLTRAGLYDIKWSEFMATSLDYSHKTTESENTDKEIHTSTTEDRIGIDMLIRNNLGVGFGYIWGQTEESADGKAMDKEGEITGYDAGINSRYPFDWGNLGLKLGYEHKDTEFENGDSQSDMAKAGVFVEW